MKRYILKTKDNVILADVTVHDNSDLTLEVITDNSINISGQFIDTCTSVMNAGRHAGKAIRLTDIYNWQLVKDSEFNVVILIPTKK